MNEHAITADPASTDDVTREWLQQVRPPDWKNPTSSGRYNLVVVGAGTAGLVTAAVAAQLGGKVALCERHLMGGDCLNVGCVPSKAVIAAARSAARVRGAGKYGVHVPEFEVSFEQAMQRMRRIRAGISHHDSASRFRGLGADVFLGDARFLDPTTLEVDGQKLSFKKAVIATGGRAAAPDIPGIDQVDYLTNETLFDLTERPQRLGVIGGGPIGCEMAQAFAQLGSEVVLLERGTQILNKDEEDAASLVRQAMERDGVRIFDQVSDVRVESTDQIELHFKSNGGTHTESVTHLLVAAGRQPNVESLGLEQAGVEYDARRGVQVNDYLQTTNPRIYAAGDVCGRYQFTHAADFMARTVITNSLFFKSKKLSSLTIPWCTYTTPELAHVGLTPSLAAERSIKLDTYDQPLDQVDRALLAGTTEGFVRIHTRRGSDRIVGATIVAEEAGELISQITLAMNQKIGLKEIAGTIYPYPTIGEAIRKVGDQYQRTRVSPWISQLLKRWMAWQR